MGAGGEVFGGDNDDDEEVLKFEGGWFVCSGLGGDMVRLCKCYSGLEWVAWRWVEVGSWIVVIGELGVRGYEFD